MPSLAGHKLDKYEVLEEVGHGGMAVVYRGRDTVLDREVAVKVLHTHLADRDESRRRLQREAKTVAKLRHENIVEIFDSSDPDQPGDTYIICEFIHGVTLRDWLDKRRKTRPVLAAMIAHRLCLALEHAHSLGIVHRDIKPENVMIRDDGCLKLMDFGIAQILDTQRLTTTGQLLGSPAYMAPELISGKPLDSRIDIFALGVMLYQIATSELPFAGRNPAQVLNRILEGDYRPPGQVESRVDQDLAAIIQKALALKPNDRYQNASSMAADIATYLAFHELEPKPEELAAYFANPDTWEVELDARVCRVLTRKATRAMRDGQGARALKLLSRVLEIDPDDGRAKSMLGKVRLRGQRMRQLAMVGGLLALIGSVAAAVVLMQPEPPTPGRVDVDVQVPLANGPNVITPYADNPVEPAELIGATGDETGDGDDPPDGPSTGTGSNGERPPGAAECEIKVEDLPAATLAGGTYKLDIPGPVDLALPASGIVDVELASAADIRLKGDFYSGSVWVDPVDCEGVSVLHAAAKPAKLKFEASDELLAKLTVTCEDGCVAKSVSAKNFRALNFPKGETEMQVVLTFKAEGFRSQAGKRFALNPGTNAITVDLEKLP